MRENDRVIVTAELYDNSSLVAIIQFFLSERGKWAKVIADKVDKDVIEERTKSWAGLIDNGQDIFDVLHDLRDGLGFDYKIVAVEVVE